LWKERRSSHARRAWRIATVGRLEDISHVIAQITPVASAQPRRRPHVGYASSGDPTAARRVDELLADGFGE